MLNRDADLSVIRQIRLLTGDTESDPAFQFLDDQAIVDLIEMNKYLDEDMNPVFSMKDVILNYLRLFRMKIGDSQPGRASLIDIRITDIEGQSDNDFVRSAVLPGVNPTQSRTHFVQYLSSLPSEVDNNRVVVVGTQFYIGINTNTVSLSITPAAGGGDIGYKDSPSLGSISDPNLVKELYWDDSEDDIILRLESLSNPGDISLRIGSNTYALQDSARTSWTIAGSNRYQYDAEATVGTSPFTSGRANQITLTAENPFSYWHLLSISEQEHSGLTVAQVNALIDAKITAANIPDVDPLFLRGNNSDFPIGRIPSDIARTDQIPSAFTGVPTSTTDSAGSPGTSSNYARGDHSHHSAAHGQTGGVTSQQVDDRIDARVDDIAEKGNTSRWGKAKVPSDTVYDADLNAYVQKSNFNNDFDSRYNSRTSASDFQNSSQVSTAIGNRLEPFADQTKESAKITPSRYDDKLTQVVGAFLLGGWADATDGQIRQVYFTSQPTEADNYEQGTYGSVFESNTANTNVGIVFWIPAEEKSNLSNFRIAERAVQDPAAPPPFYSSSSFVHLSDESISGDNRSYYFLNLPTAGAEAAWRIQKKSKFMLDRDDVDLENFIIPADLVSTVQNGGIVKLSDDGQSFEQATVHDTGILKSLVDGHTIGISPTSTLNDFRGETAATKVSPDFDLSDTENHGDTVWNVTLTLSNKSDPNLSLDPTDVVNSLTKSANVFTEVINSADPIDVGTNTPDGEEAISFPLYISGALQAEVEFYLAKESSTSADLAYYLHQDGNAGNNSYSAQAKVFGGFNRQRASTGGGGGGLTYRELVNQRITLNLNTNSPDNTRSNVTTLTGSELNRINSTTTRGMWFSVVENVSATSTALSTLQAPFSRRGSVDTLHTWTNTSSLIPLSINFRDTSNNQTIAFIQGTINTSSTNRTFTYTWSGGYSNYRSRNIPIVLSFNLIIAVFS